MTHQAVLGFTSLLVAALCSWRCVYSFSTGPPPSACSTLSPDPFSHGASPQESSSPYQVDLSSLQDAGGGLSYEPGETYQSKCHLVNAAVYQCNLRIRNGHTCICGC